MTTPSPSPLSPSHPTSFNWECYSLTGPDGLEQLEILCGIHIKKKVKHIQLKITTSPKDFHDELTVLNNIWDFNFSRYPLKLTLNGSNQCKYKKECSKLRSSIRSQCDPHLSSPSHLSRG